jgi:steroid delta-isomerase
MDEQAIRQQMLSYLARVDACDIEGILALYARDAVVEDPVGSPPRVGIQAIEHFYREGLGRANPSAELTGEIQVEDQGRRAAMPFRVDVDMAGQRCSIHVTDVMTFDAEGRILTMQAHWDERSIEQHPPAE